MPEQTAFTVRSGDVTRWSQTLIPTLREAPAEAESPSHVLMLRAGYIRKLGAGIYDYLPLATRVLSKVSNIVRQEMNAAGASELLLPVLLPTELYAGTKRDVDYGELLFKIHDRKNASYALGPTHEEPITELVKGSVTSYKQLPVNLYQIQTKFRDEARPRSGLLRGREFIMKDAYSFHTAVEGPGGLNETYDAMYTAYSNIFRRCGLSFVPVEAESGPIGGSASHEFMVTCESGEDTILRCPVSGYAANVEKCEIGARPRGTFNEPPTGELTEVHTPNLPGIDEVGKFMKVKPDRMLKSIVFEIKGSEGSRDQGTGKARWALAVVRGDHDVNEGKVKIAVRAITGDEKATVALADEKAARAAGFAIGYVSPRTVNSVPGTVLLVDNDASGGGFWASGSDKPDHHVKHFNWRREVGAALDDASKVCVVDVRNAIVGDPSPRSEGAKLEAAKGIEVGHIFKLGTKYSEAMGFEVLLADQQRKPVIMGCYGIGVSRTMAATVEQNHDADGIRWPMPIAPYHVIITLLRVDEEGPKTTAMEIAKKLAAIGLDVLIDDRDERPGVKFKDADLIGVPIRLTVADKALAVGAVEFKVRGAAEGANGGGKGTLCPLADVVSWCAQAARDGGLA
ncbi:MAG: proline--tRNA ligase [Phycisphaerales bacterium]|nr:proline--tRNA ligase [Phycisphaerales bacterium]